MKELIKKYKEGSLNTKELLRLQKLLDSADDKVIGEVFGNEDTLDSYSCDNKEVLSRMKLNINLAIASDRQRHKWSNILLKGVAVSAAVLIPALIVLCVYIYRNPTVEPAADALCTISTGVDEKSTVRLPDGSEVMMTGLSSLRFNAAGGNDCRSIQFSGEAYFNISRDPDHPFLINTGNMIVKVYGTSFSLSAREGSECSGVMLDNGSLEIISRKNSQTARLNPGEMAVYNDREASFTIEPIKVKEKETPQQTVEQPADTDTPAKETTKVRPEIPVWAFSGIKLDNVSQDSVIRVIEKTYHIELNPSIREAINENFTGTLPDNDLNRTLLILSKIYKFQMPFTIRKED